MHVELPAAGAVTRPTTGHVTTGSASSSAAGAGTAVASAAAAVQSKHEVISI